MSKIQEVLTEILRAYENHLDESIEIKVSPDRYLTEQYERIAHVSKLVAMSANGEDPDKFFRVKAFNKELERMDEAEPIDLIIEELQSWGISEDSFIFRVVTSIPEIEDYNCDFSTCIEQLSKILHTNRFIIASTITDLVRIADFSKTKYSTVLAKMPRKEITNDIVVNELMDFCR